IKGYPNIRPIRAAIWSDQSAILSLSNPGAQKWAFAITDNASAEGPRVPAVTIGDLLKQSGCRRIDILKIDIEGAESRVFADDRCHEWLDGTTVLAVELHDE